jgi:DNA modification methylase
MPVLVFGKTTTRWPYNLPDMLREEDDPHDVTNTDHPFAKGVDAYTFLVGELTPEHGLVVDPFMGTGTSGAAAIIMGRRFVGMETHPRWFREATGNLESAVEAREIYEEEEAELDRPHRRPRSRRPPTSERILPNDLRG